MIEGRGAQSLRDGPYHRRYSVNLGGDVVQPVDDLVPKASHLREPRHVQIHDKQCLTDAVVKLAREIRADLFDLSMELHGQTLERTFRMCRPSVSDVRID